MSLTHIPMRISLQDFRACFEEYRKYTTMTMDGWQVDDFIDDGYIAEVHCKATSARMHIDDDALLFMYIEIPQAQEMKADKGMQA